MLFRSRAITDQNLDPKKDYVLGKNNLLIDPKSKSVKSNSVSIVENVKNVDKKEVIEETTNTKVVSEFVVPETAKKIHEEKLEEQTVVQQFVPKAQGNKKNKKK